jgi:hypothetical protein
MGMNGEYCQSTLEIPRSELSFVQRALMSGMPVVVVGGPTEKFVGQEKISGDTPTEIHANLYG